MRFELIFKIVRYVFNYSITIIIIFRGLDYARNSFRTVFVIESKDQHIISHKTRTETRLYIKSKFANLCVIIFFFHFFFNTINVLLVWKTYRLGNLTKNRFGIKINKVYTMVYHIALCESAS